MKIFDLKCIADHRFEGWFEDLSELEGQIAQGMVSCPVCGEQNVRRVPSSFAIKAKRPAEITPQNAAQLMGQAVMRYLQENFDDVGPKFATEALKIHYGVSEPRDIRGVSTPEEEKMLAKEGVEFFKIGPAKPAETPTPDLPGSSDNDED